MHDLIKLELAHALLHMVYHRVLESKWSNQQDIPHTWITSIQTLGKESLNRVVPNELYISDLEDILDIAEDLDPAWLDEVDDGGEEVEGVVNEEFYK